MEISALLDENAEDVDLDMYDPDGDSGNRGNRNDLACCVCIALTYTLYDIYHVLCSNRVIM